MPLFRGFFIPFKGILEILVKSLSEGIGLTDSELRFSIA